MNSYERVMTALGHKEPDRVPLFLFFTMHGAKELGMSLRDYFSSAEHVAEGQRQLHAKYGHDCLYPFFYGALAVEAFGQRVEFYDDGPPNAGPPIITRREDIFSLIAPDAARDEGLMRSVRAIELLAPEFKKRVPIISAVIGPFSLPIMLMGLKQWIELFIHNDSEAISAMLRITGAFCLRQTNALFEAGADAVGLFEPFATTTMVTRNEFQSMILAHDKALVAQMKGPIVFCGAGGRWQPVIDLMPELGVAGCVLSTDDDLAAIKTQFGTTMNLIGNLNNVAMTGWSYDEARAETQRCLLAGKRGGGYILADQHGEISWSVGENTLRGIIDATREFGCY